MNERERERERERQRQSECICVGWFYCMSTLVSGVNSTVIHSTKCTLTIILNK